MLVKLLAHHSLSDKYSFIVVSLISPGRVAREISALGIPVYSLNIKTIFSVCSATSKLVRIIKNFKPDIVQTWLFHADLIGLLAVKIAGFGKVIWGVRCGNFTHSMPTWIIVKLCALLSHFPDKIIFNSNTGRDHHLQHWHYKPSSHTVIHNGFDLDIFYRASEAKPRLCHRLNIDKNSFIIGGAGRFDISKDYKTFLSVVHEVHQQVPEIRFILCGLDITYENNFLSELIDSYNIHDAIFLMGEQVNMQEFLSSLDLFLLTSYSEGCPNVVGEAMACKTPCVVTNSGDSALLVGDTGFVCLKKDYQGIAEVILQFYRMSYKEKEHYRLSSRKRIQDNFSINDIVLQYEQVYKEILL